jgi:hypothetical protein
MVVKKIAVAGEKWQNSDLTCGTSTEGKLRLKPCLMGNSPKHHRLLQGGAFFRSGACPQGKGLHQHQISWRLFFDEAGSKGAVKNDLIN